MKHSPLNFDMTRVQYLNYVAVALIHLAGNHAPTEVDIRHVEQELNSIFKRLANKKLYATREVQQPENNCIQ